jgi:hypothetical protein
MLLNSPRSSFSVSCTNVRNSGSLRVSNYALSARIIGEADHCMICVRSHLCQQPSLPRPGGDRRSSKLQYPLSRVQWSFVWGSTLRWSNLRNPFFRAGRSKWPCLRVSRVAQSSSTRAFATLALLVSIVVLLSSVYHGCGSGAQRVAALELGEAQH